MKGMTKVLLTGLLLMFGTILVSCSGGLQGPKNPFGSGDWVNSICYSGYRNGQGPGASPTEAQILEDLNILKKKWNYIRLYDTSAHAERTLKVIHDNHLPLKVLQGVWIATNDFSANTNQITNMFRLLQEYSDEILAVSVGNECVVSWSGYRVGVDQEVGFINMVKAWMASNSTYAKPVTMDDDFAVWQSSANDALINAVDFITMHSYPFKRKQNYTDGLNITQEDYALVKANSKGKYIAIGEAGWSTAGYNASLNLQGAANEWAEYQYYNDLIAWAKENNIITFYFEAFDEAWKGAQTDPEPHYGLFTTNRKAKWAMIKDYPSLKEPGHVYTSNNVVITVASNSYDITNAEITSDIFVVYSETVSGQTNSAAFWNVWEGSCIKVETNLDPYEGSSCLYLLATPAGWGWGIGNETHLADHSNLSEFTNGYLVFSVKTLYSGSIAFGFQSGIYNEPGWKDDFLIISSGEYGYVNDGAWHRVVIPVQTLMAVQPGAMMFNINATFAIQDLASSDTVNEMYLDNIYWTQTTNTNL
jgi:exo-beta-1,3-glucanase (GH17 family)